VYPLIDGAREILVFAKHLAEAKSFVEMAIGELARNMTKSAIEVIFQNPEYALEESKKEKWKAFANPTFIKENGSDNYRNKRSRTIQDETLYHRYDMKNHDTQKTSTMAERVARANQPIQAKGSGDHNNQQIQALSKEIQELKKIVWMDKQQTKAELDRMQEQVDVKNKILKDKITTEFDKKLDIHTKKTTEAIDNRIDQVQQAITNNSLDLQKILQMLAAQQQQNKFYPGKNKKNIKTGNEHTNGSQLTERQYSANCGINKEKSQEMVVEFLTQEQTVETLWESNDSLEHQHDE
jgi:hypothetical protein